MSNLMESESKLTITLPQSIRVKTLDGTFIECGGKDLLKTSLECKLTSRKIDISLSL